MATPNAGTALTAYGINLVNKDEGGPMGLGRIEQIADTARAHSHKHLHKVRAGDMKERHTCLSGHGARQHGFSTARRAKQQHAFWNLRSQSLKLLGVL